MRRSLWVSGTFLLAISVPVSGQKSSGARLWSGLQTGMNRQAAIEHLKRSEGKTPLFKKKDSLTYFNISFLSRTLDVIAEFDNDALSAVTLTSKTMCFDEAVLERKVYDDALSQKYKALGSTSGPTDYVDSETLVTVSIKPLGMPDFPREPSPPYEKAALYNILFLQYKQHMQTWLSSMERVRVLRERCASQGGSTANVEVKYQSKSDAQRSRAVTATQAQADDQDRKKRQAEESERSRRQQEADKDKI